MGLRKYFPWLIAGGLGLGAVFWISSAKNCNRNKSETSVKEERKKPKKRRYMPRRVRASRTFLDNMVDESAEPDLFDDTLQECTDAKDFSTAAKLLGMDERVEDAVELLEKNGEYFKAAKLAKKEGMQDLARDIMIEGLENAEEYTNVQIEFLESLGTHADALKFFKENHHDPEAVKMAVKLSDLDEARVIYENRTEWDGHKGSMFQRYYEAIDFDPKDLMAIGHFEEYEQQCQESTDWFEENYDLIKVTFKGIRDGSLKLENKEVLDTLGKALTYERCYQGLLKVQGKYRELAEFKLERFFRAPAIEALDMANEHNFTIDGLEKMVEDELYERSIKHSFVSECIDLAVKLGYGEKWANIYKDIQGINTTYIEMEKKNGNIPAVFDSYEILAEDNSTMFVEAAKYAQSLGMFKEERRYLQDFLDNKDRCPDYYDKDSLTAYALARLGRVDEARDFCESLKQGRCKCKAEILYALYEG